MLKSGILTAQPVLPQIYTTYLELGLGIPHVAPELVDFILFVFLSEKTHRLTRG
jgi:hypothetical protein